MRERVPIIAITGTKGKTTVTRILSDLIQRHVKYVLRVDTTGAYISEKQIIDLEGSLNFTGLVPTVSPGKFVPYLYQKSHDVKDCAAVLEAALGSSARPGLGYKNHNVGVFTNVLEDHIGSSKRIQTQQDIADAKDFIFSRISQSGWAVINADDKFVMGKIGKIPDIDIKKIFCTIDQKLAKSFAGNYVCTVQAGKVAMIDPKGKVSECADIASVSWTFGGQYVPSIYNLLFVTSAFYAFFNGRVNMDTYKKQIEITKLDEEGGRLTCFTDSRGVKILADYAHEKYSLKAIARLAHGMKAKGGKVIGVLRLAYDRTDDLIRDTAKYISDDYDSFIIYDKIDGFLKKPIVTDPHKKFKQVVGKISTEFSSSLIENGATDVERIVREDEALNHASLIAKAGDVVVFIVNDDIKQSIGFVRKSFAGARRTS